MTAQSYVGMGPCKHGDGCVDLVHLRAVEAARIANGRERDIYRQDRDTCRALLMSLVATTDLRKAPDSIKVRLRETLREFPDAS